MAVSVHLPDDLYVQDLSAPGADLGSVTVSGCADNGTPSAFTLSTTLINPGAGSPKVVNVPFSASQEPELALSTVGSWFGIGELSSGGEIEFTAFCSAPAVSASATLDSAVFAFTVPTDVTIATLAATQSSETASVGICREGVRLDADYHYQIQAGLDVSMPIALAYLDVDAERRATFPLEFLSTWLQQRQPSRVGAQIVLTANCYSPLMQTTYTIPLGGNLAAPPPEPTQPPGDGGEASGPGTDSGAPAPGAAAAPPAALADTGGPAPASAGVALGAVVLFGLGLVLRIRSRSRHAR